MKKVSLYVREHSTRKLVKANSKTTYPMDATFVLRYGDKWETLRGHHSFAEASVAAQRKQLNLFTGEETITLSPRPRSGALDSSIDAYLDSTAEHKSHKTWLAYSKALRGFYASCRCASLAAITLETLKAFVSKMRKENLSDRTIANRLANVVCFLKTHKIDGSLTHPYVEKTVRAYREDEVRAFFKACQKYPELWLLFQFFLCTGAREQEVMHVHYSDIDYKDSIYNVTAKANWRPKDLAERD
jgi:integrase